MMAICVLLLAMMMIAGAAATAEQVEYLATHPQQSSPADHDHRLSKRMDLEVCIGHFDVHKNTIIRTGESQAIGGKYLQGLELDTIEECERLCCETDACDVYIFERKTGGYCYLFECGPPENFHCKFTRHSNYTSAVLTPQARQTSELASTPRPQLPHIPSNNISQQEWELSNLKLKPEARDKPPTGSLSVAPTGSGSGAGAGVAQAAVNPVQSGVPTAHCSRFQFTCHSGECIAVYNACDGIPQCEDGSDEGPECDTVSSSATKSSGSSSSNSIVEPVKPMVQQYLPVQNVQQQLQVAAQQQQQQQQQQQPQHVIVLGPPPPPPPPPPMVNNREDAAAWANRKMITEGQQQQQQLQPQQQLQLQQQQQQQQTGSITTDEQSHIFSHKGGLQLQQQPSANVQVQGQLQGQAQGPSVVQVQGQSTPLQVSGYESNQAMYGMSLPRTGMYVSQQQQQSQNPQQQLQQASSSGQQMPPNVVWPQQQQQQQLPVQQQRQQPPQQQGHVYAPAAPAPPPQHQTAAMLPVLNAAPAQGKNQAPSVDGDYEDYDEETYTEAPKKKQHKHKKVKAKTSKDPIELALEQNKQQQEAAAASLPSAALLVPVSAVHEQYKMIHENLAMEFRDHDGHSERPGGAVLSLTLGLLVTAALAILIGCRMRTVSRRARRLGGKTPYSQEADFLVNGMYL